MSKALKIVSLNSLTKRVKVGFVGTCEKYYCSKEDGFPIIRTTDLIDNGIDFSNLKYITKEFYDKEKKSQLNKGDLLIARHGDNGKAKIYKKNLPAQALNVVIIEPNQDKMSSYLLKCFFETSFVRNQILNSSSGSVQNVVNTKIINDLLIPISSDIEYKSISKLLENLEYKIELNNQINQKLESMAKTLYDYWFVQFDFPDAEGKPYKSSAGKMVYSEELKREIPEGWKIQELSDIANITMGQSPSGDSYNDNKEGTIFFQGSTDFGWRFPTIRQFTTKPNRIAKKGDILLSVRAPVGTLNMADNECCIGRGLASLNSKEGCTSYLYYVMVHFKKIFDHRNVSGTTFGSITKDDLHSLKVVYPSKEVLLKYDDIVSKYNEKILNNYKQNQKLTQLRDWLLPMLMNGQVGIK